MSTLTKVAAPGFYDGVPDVLYHAGMVGPEDAPIMTWSRSDLKYLTGEGTAAALRANRQDQLDADADAPAAKPDRKTDLVVGSAVHRYVLGVGPEVKHIPCNDWRSPRMRDARDEYDAAGFLSLNTPEYSKARAIAAAVHSHPEAAAILQHGRAEVSAYAIDEPTGLWLRCRPDWITPTELADYKTAESAAPSAFAKAAWTYGYYLQDPFYRDICAALGHPAERFRYLVQEKRPPYLVAVYELDDDSVALGRAHYQQALDRLAACLEADTWPGYPDTTQPLRLPYYAFQRRGLTSSGAVDDGPAVDATGVLDDLERILRS